MANKLMRMKAKKVILIIIMMSICFGLLYGVSLFTGPPFGKIIAKSKISNYTKAVYGNTHSIDKIFYNFKDSSYHAIFSDNSFNIRYDPFKNILTDRLFQEKVSAQFKSDYQELTKAFPDTIEFPSGHIYTGIIANGKYSTQTDNIKVRQKLYVLGITNWDPNITMEESMKKPADITRRIIDELGYKYNITGVQIIYIDANGVFEIVDEFSKRLCDDLEGKTVKKEKIGSLDEQTIKSIKLKGKK